MDITEGFREQPPREGRSLRPLVHALTQTIRMVVEMKGPSGNREIT